MNLPGNVSGRMEYIQRLFLEVQEPVEKIKNLDEIVAFLDNEPLEFRSVAYESASMVIGFRDLCNEKNLHTWKLFRQACSTQHTFHADIGLGWAFAKAGLHPREFLETVNPVVRQMVFDGIGYFNGLFKCRKTVLNKIVPDDITGAELGGFDQGLGRRLWYMVKGDVAEVKQLVQGFAKERQPDLWRGVGIACGYVGGVKQEALTSLLTVSAGFSSQFITGIKLAVISRIASNSVNEDANLACLIVCNQTIEELKDISIEALDNFIYISASEDSRDCFSSKQIRTSL